MAYVDPYNAATPSDISDASQGDDRIRELKRAITERLATFFENWPDGEPITAAGAHILLGARQGEELGDVTTEAALMTGGLLYDSQTKKLYTKFDGSNVVVALELTALAEFSSTFKSGLAAARPNPADTDFYYSTDTNVLSVREGNGWVEVNPVAAVSPLTRGKVRFSNGGIDLDLGGAGVGEMIPWDDPIYGQGTVVDIIANPTRLTVPANKGGTYLICGVVSGEHNDTEHTLTVEVVKNGATIIWSCLGEVNQQNKAFAINTTDAAAAGDYYEVRVKMSSGADFQIDANRCYFEMVRLGD